MSELNIVLIEPEIPANTGNIARTCALTGAHLHLVKPLGFSIDDKHVKRAGLDYWHLLDLTIYENQKDFLEKTKGKPYYFFTTKALTVHSNMTYKDGAYLIFGKETAGIDEELLLQHKDKCVRIPMIDNEDARSLNLSNSVAIAAYEVLRQWDYPDFLLKGQLHRHIW